MYKVWTIQGLQFFPDTQLSDPRLSWPQPPELRLGVSKTNTLRGAITEKVKICLLYRGCHSVGSSWAVEVLLFPGGVLAHGLAGEVSFGFVSGACGWWLHWAKGWQWLSARVRSGHRRSSHGIGGESSGRGRQTLSLSLIGKDLCFVTFCVSMNVLFCIIWIATLKTN